MKIALIGYGNMGKELEAVIAPTSHKIVSISYRTPQDPLDVTGIKGADVAIDFTSPEVILKTIKKVLGLKINMVVGTTGGYDQLSTVEKIVKQTKTGFMYGQNFSVGANIFFQIVDFAGKLIGKFEDYDVAGFEIHHTGKKDSPSGTAKKLSNIVTRNFPSKKTVETGRMDRQIQKEEFHFASLRTGRFPGFHEIIFDSFADDIRLSHNAHNRRGFAQGALLAAEFIKGKKGMYSFDDIFKKVKR